MTELWVREIGSNSEQLRYRWRIGESGEQGVCTLPELSARWPQASLTLVIAGVECLSRSLTFKLAEKAHLARLLPFELEAELAQDITSLHVALGTPEQSPKNTGKNPDKNHGERFQADHKSPEVIVSYMDKRALGEQIGRLESAGFDVRHCYAEPLLLGASDTDWLLRLLDGQVDISWGRGRVASVELSMLGVYLDSLLHAPGPARATEPQQLRLQALTADELNDLQRQVSSSALMQNWQPGMSTEELHNAWHGLAGCGQSRGTDADQARSAPDKVSVSIPDLRQGAFARPVRWQKLWRPARVPLIAAGLAALVFVAVTLIEIQLNNQRFRQLQQEIETVYRDVVPAGVLVDAEQQLRAQLGQLRGPAATGNVLVMLDKVTPSLVQDAQLSITRMSYNGAGSATAQAELQLSIAADSNTDILQFSERLNNSGLQARAQNMTQAGSRQQASMIITESAP